MIIEPWFDRAVLIVILVNCVTLALEDPLKTKVSTAHKGFEWFFMVFYTVEMLLKMFAKGVLLEPNSYLRDWWNILDFMIVMVSWISMVSNKISYTNLRIIRVLRTLRTITAMPSMASLVKSLLRLIPAMGNMVLLFSMIVILFSTIAV